MNKLSKNISNNWFVWDCAELPPMKSINKALSKAKGLRLYEQETGSTHYDCIVAKNKKEAQKMFHEIYPDIPANEFDVKLFNN